MNEEISFNVVLSKRIVEESLTEVKFQGFSYKPVCACVVGNIYTKFLTS